jgi:hypothetical protein
MTDACAGEIGLTIEATGRFLLMMTPLSTYMLDDWNSNTFSIRPEVNGHFALRNWDWVFFFCNPSSDLLLDWTSL